MKFLVVICILCICFDVISTKKTRQILGGRYNTKTKKIEIDVTYGGCSGHKFKLEHGPCASSLPPQCITTLIDTTGDDPCAKITRETVSFSLKQAGFKGEHFRGAHITVKGAGDSSAEFTLPKKKKQ